jgi:hypothetical protein
VNRSQRRALAKKKGHGRVTPKKEKAPRMFATVTDEAGNEKRVELHGTRVSQEEAEAAQRRETERLMAESEHAEQSMRLRAHVHGLWVPGDPIPGQER